MIYTISTEKQGSTTFEGDLLGSGTSHSADHSHPGGFISRTPVNGRRASCSACRWFEVSLYWDVDAGQYVVHTIGRSIVPEEIDYARIARTHSPYEVLEFLTVRQPGNVFIASPSLHALAQAAHLDEGIRDAYVNRAIA